MKKEKSHKHNLDIVTLLTLVFVVLKLINHIKWSWVWVLSPPLDHRIVFSAQSLVLY